MRLRDDEPSLGHAELRRAELLATIARLEEENALLRRAVDERTLAPATRRVVGLAAGVAIVVTSLSMLAWFMFHDATPREVRGAFMKGYDRATTVAPAPPTAPRPTAPVRVEAPRR